MELCAVSTYFKKSMSKSSKLWVKYIYEYHPQVIMTVRGIELYLYTGSDFSGCMYIPHTMCVYYPWMILYTTGKKKKILTSKVE